MKKRLLSMLLVLVMLLGILPVQALAVDMMPVERVSTGEEDPVQITKSLESNGDGTYRITMESYVTGTVVQGKPEPLDIVLVLDQSGSMAFNFNGEETRDNTARRQYAMKNAVNSFIGKVADHSPENYISVVTFSSNASILADWTEVTTEGKAALTSSINGLPDSPQGATNVAAGMTKANSLLERANNSYKKFVIVFTDGVPTTQSDFSTGVATSAIQAAKDMKDAGATVYTIGIFNGADPSELHGDKYERAWPFSSNECNGNVGEYWGSTSIAGMVNQNDFNNYDIPAGNRFLNYLSNNFVDANSIGLRFDDSDGLLGGYKWIITENFQRSSDDYYLIATNASALESIFGQIAESIVPAVAAGSNAVLSDTLTDHFEFAIGEDGKVRGLSAKVYSASGSGETPNWAEVPAEIEPVISGKTITAAGFDYSGNPVVKGNDGWTGRKLVISFDIQPDVNADWMRGTNLYDTNNTTGSKAGLSVDGSALSELGDSPNVAVTAYGVTYSWTGLPEGASVTIPVDNHVYLEGAAVTLDTTYTSTTTTKVGHDTYTFSGWTSVVPALVDGKMPGSNVVVSGTWTKTATDPTYTVTYSWTGLPEGAAVTVPVDSAKYYEGDAVTLDTTFTSTTTTKVGHDTYTFSGWTSVVPALEDGKMPGSNVVVSGTWTKTATDPTYTVTYSWTGLPEGATVTVPVDSAKYYEGDAVTLDTTFTSTTTTKVGHDTYTFSGWTSVVPALEDGKMPGSNVVVSGTWTKTATDPTYTVTYSWTGLPEGAAVTVPVDSAKYYEGDAVTLDTTFTSTTTTKVGHDTYTFSGWTSVVPALEDGKMPGSNVAVSGTWTKTATDPTYTVTYSWTGLPEGAAVTVPVDSAKYYEGDAVTLDTTFTSTSTTTIDGTIYTFSGWTSVVPALVDGKMPGSNVAVSGTWVKTFVPAPGLCVTKDAYAINGKPVEAGKAYTVKTGDVVTWMITVSNEGNVALRNVSVTDVLSIGKAGAELELYNTDGNKVTAVDLMPKGTDGDVVVLYANYTVTMRDQGEKLINTVVADAGDNGPKDMDIDDSIKVQNMVIHVPVLNKKDHVAYIIGYEDDTVRPENNITRAEVATIFFRLLTDDSRARYWSQTNAFSDVSSSDWFNNAVSTMANAGILTGYPDGTFKPNAPITRAEFAAIAARFSDVTYNGACSFTDVAKTHWAFDEISLAEHLGWITGYPDDTFRPSRNITRAEAMTLINRVLERAVEEDHMHRDMVKWIDNSPSAWYYEAVQEATNSHTYTRLSKKVPGQSFCYEDWTGILKAPDWAALEKSWSDANDR